MDYVYRFPVVRGLQAGREYFIGMVPLKMISRLFPNDEEYVPPEYRAQRKLNTSRIPEISKYILQNRHDYVFSALAASIDGKFKFIPADLTSDIGVLEVSMDARFQINDGQHRKAAIIEALVEDETLGDETISVVFFEDKGLTRSQQIFTDLNKHAVKTSNSISELYDSRDDLAVVTRKVVSSVKFINTFTDKEKDNLGKFSSNLFALNMFYKANKKIVQRMDVDTECEKFLIEFWSCVSENIVRVGNYFFMHQKSDMHAMLKRLQNIDWKRTAPQWHLRTIRANGRMISSETAVVLTANVIKQSLGIELDEDEKMKEQKFLNR